MVKVSQHNHISLVFTSDDDTDDVGAYCNWSTYRLKLIVM